MISAEEAEHFPLRRIRMLSLLARGVFEVEGEATREAGRTE